jgi:integrase
MILAALSVFFSCAQEAGLVLANPTTRMGKNYRQTRRLREEIQPLTAAEVPVLLRAALETFPEYYPLFLCAIHTGLRSGELAGLQWGDLDFNGKFLTVRRTVVGKRIHKPKTNKFRRVDMSDALMLTLQDLRRRLQEKKLASGQNELPEWVFSNREGKPPDMQNVKNRAFHPSS